VISLSSIRIHPVKSTAIRSVPGAAVDSLGLVGDRRWMVVDADGECVTARTDRRLFTIVGETHHTVAGLRVPLRLSAPDHETIDVAEPASDAIRVTVFGRAMRAIPADDAAGDWVRAVVGRPDVTLVRVAEPRPLNPTYARAGRRHRVRRRRTPSRSPARPHCGNFAEWIATRRGGAAREPADGWTASGPTSWSAASSDPFAEDGVESRHHRGPVTFRVVKGIDRCAMTMLDPADADQPGPEPIRTLSRHRKWDGATWFGIQLIPDDAGLDCRVGRPTSPPGRV
jgi:uncharacterized protein YcbX